MAMGSDLLDFQFVAYTAKTEDDELRGNHRRHANFADQPTLVDGLGRIVAVIALDVESVFGAIAYQRAVAPQGFEERCDAGDHALAQSEVVRPKHGPLHGA